MKRILTNTLALLVVIAVLATVNPVSAADLTADRTISGIVCPGSTFTVTVDLTVTGSPVNGLSITEDLSALPSDWTVSPNNGGIYSPTTKKVEYVWFDASGNLGSQSVTYDVKVPGTATIGTSCDITGDAGITPPGSTVAIGTDTVTVVSCGTGPTLTADRTISGIVCPGSTFTVTVDLTVTGSPVNGLSITEDLSALPSDWTVSPNNGGIYSPTTKKVEYVWFDASGNLGSQSVTYDVKVPGTATIGTSCDITGDAGITPPGSTVAIGTDTVTVVSCGTGPTLTADRTISGIVCPGSTFTVTVDLTVTGSPVNGLSITEDLSALPSDWTVSPNNGGIYSPTTKKVEYVWFDASGNLGSQSVTYDVTVPGTATIGTSCDITGDAGITPPGSTVAIGTDTVTVVLCNDPPTVTVTYPVDGTVSGTIDVTADANDDPDGTVTQVEFFLIPGSSIGTDANGADGWSVPLDTTTVTDGNYQIRAVATDDGGATGENTGSAFAIDNSCPCDFCLELEAGLNFVSIPKTLDDPKDATTLFEIDDFGGEVCWYYDAGAGYWDDNADVKPCRGYLVRKNAPMDICENFDDGAATPQQQLYTGWNMIGAVSMDTMPIHNSGIDDTDFASVTGLEEPEGNKLFIQMNTYTPTGWINYPTGPLTEVTPGMGYTIVMTEDAMMYGIP